MIGNEFDEFVEKQENLVALSAEIAFGVDRLKLDLVDKGWDQRAAEITAANLFNTMLMMNASSR